jgi:uncharacterized protein YjgD (DUF1641 family)
MAKKKMSKTPSKRKKAKEKVSKVIDQVKEPLSLLNTLKEEGVANALTFLTMASAVAEGAKKNLKLEMVKPQLKDLVGSLGFALREDLERLEARLEELEHKLSEKEYAAMGEDE